MVCGWSGAPPPVGASLLAMVVNDNAGSLAPRGVLEIIVGTPPGASSLLQGECVAFRTVPGTRSAGARRSGDG
ncbi:hypothetical protein C9422_23875 [Pseudomonas sp. B1(2018)]|nr:hypothetical protein C9422_23875 [Pseudomonas sp. B1(2018)]